MLVQEGKDPLSIDFKSIFLLTEILEETIVGHNVGWNGMKTH